MIQPFPRRWFPQQVGRAKYADNSCVEKMAWTSGCEHSAVVVVKQTEPTDTEHTKLTTSYGRYGATTAAPLG